MAVSLEQFVQNLSQSGLMSATDVQSFQDTLPPERKPKDGENLARELVRANKLTKYQAQVVYQGKVKGLVFGDYRVLDKLGQGGMGVVLKAEHRRMKRAVAVKMIAGAALGSAEAVKRFYREVEAAAKLNHTNIVTAYDAGEQDGVHYLVMEYVEGKDLGAIVAEKGALPIAKAVDYVIQAARGLQYAHKQNIVHRDIKPANLLLDKEGTVKILDMGLARIAGLVGQEEKERLTASGQVMGTCDYMAPEQAMDTHHVDARADIYSLGCTLYRLVVGDAMYKGETLAKILISHQLLPIPSLCHGREDVPPRLDAIFQKMVAKKPEDRYQSMAEVILDLEECMGVKGASGTSANAEATAAFAMDDNLSFLKDSSPRGGAAVKKQVEQLAEATIAPRPAAETSKQLVPEKKAQVQAWPQKKKTLVLAIGLGTLGVLGLIALAVIIIIRNPDGTETVIKAPDGSKVTVSESFSDPVSLFDGKTLQGWHLQYPGGPNYWSVEGGQLVCTPQPPSDSKNLVTDQTFGDFELKLEFFLEPRANSGVYLRGLYEVQIFDSDPDALSQNSCGAIFKAVAPTQKAYLGPGQWNTLEVKLVGQRVTVSMNGKQIIDDAPLTGPTDTKQTLNLKPGEPGPIILQCMGSARTRFRNILIRNIEGKRTSGDSQPAEDAAWKGAIDLMPLIDPIKDSVEGEWKIGNGGLVGDKNSFARIEMPYQPPAEYDYRVEFTPQNVGIGGCQHLVKGPRSFTWNFFAQIEHKLFGFERVNGKAVVSNPTKTALPPLEKGRRYVSLVEVRNDGVRGYLDGKLVVAWKTDYSDLDTFDGWKLRDSSRLGVGCQTRMIFHRIEIREVTGKGKFTREAPKAGNVDDAFLKEVAALPAEQQVARVVAKLKELNPGYDGNEEHKIDKGLVTELTISVVAIQDISPVRALSALEILVCAGESSRTGRLAMLADLSPLRGLRLKKFNCYNTSVSDLSVLTDMPLSSVECSACRGLADLRPLRGLPLTRLACYGTAVRDLSPIANAPLKELQIFRTSVSDLSPLAGMPLVLLKCCSTKVTDLSPIKSAPLKKIDCDFDPKRDAELLRAIKTLEEINGLPAADFWKQVEAGKVPSAELPGAVGTVGASRPSGFVTGATTLIGPDGDWKLPPGAPAPAIGPFEAKKANGIVEAWAKYLSIPVETTNSLGMKLVLVPPGEFMMGSDDPQAQPREKPVHRVRISRPYYVGKYPVTVGEFRRFAEATGYKTDAEAKLGGYSGWFVEDGKYGKSQGNESWREPGFVQTPEHPVVAVSRNDALRFCEWASKKTGAAVRLPTEAEWEYVARGPNATKYPWGDPWNGTLANHADVSARKAGCLIRHASQDVNLRYPGYDSERPGGENEDDGHAFTSPAGAYSNGSWCAARDMAGNVWQWCSDNMADDYYSQSPLCDPKGPSSGNRIARRGGSWMTDSGNCRSSQRFFSSANERDASTGFRVVVELGPTEKGGK